ncbi:MAG: D-alanyl-D-alanine carboxypeptidase/D-alanyl-D-alanine-endopeptidase [Thermoleophilaceae bacterium]|nr:D-alanyl-D-alanine carboxypeptidase/D-alanyl-D-alanine-endopeptidase [Thermoleophilaceae bacterium]
MRRATATSGAYVLDLTSGAQLFAMRSAKPRILASNTKLFTTAAALNQYGPDGTFATALWSSGALGADGTLTGDLVIRGGGDPMFGSEAFVKRYYGTGASVEGLARALFARGVRHVTGNVLGDDTLFDLKRGTAPYGFRQSGEIGGALDALAFERGPWSASEVAASYTASKLRNALKAAGIAVDGKPLVGGMPAGAVQLASATSPSVARIIAYTNKPSDNYLAEMLMKRLAVGTTPATTAAGAASAASFAASLGSRVQLADGSGLSRSDMAAPREVVDLLAGMYQRADFATYFGSLSVPGRDGTLARRMGASSDTRRCGAKTGTLRDVSSLSGYCTNRAGHVIAFSLIMNNTYAASARTIQDQIATRIATSK